MAEERQQRRPTEKWRRLPERTAPKDLVETVETNPTRDVPEPAGDPDREWMLRNAGGV
jgi:hypothetical protein